MKKTILFLGLLSLLASCSNHNYQVKLVKLDNSIDSIIVDNDNIRVTSKNTLLVGCGCGGPKAYNVQSAIIIKQLPLTEKDKQENKEILLGILTPILFVLILAFFIFYKPFSKLTINKESSMIKIFRYIVYGVGIVLVFKIGLIVIHYLPTIIENQLK